MIHTMLQEAGTQGATPMNPAPFIYGVIPVTVMMVLFIITYVVRDRHHHSTIPTCPVCEGVGMCMPYCVCVGTPAEINNNKGRTS